MRIGLKIFGIGIAGALAVSGCATPAENANTAEATAAPATAKNEAAHIASMAKKLATANTLSMDVRDADTLLSIGGCTVRPLTESSEVVPSQLAAGLKKAKDYSVAQKGISLMVLKDGDIIHESYTGEAGAATLTDSFSMMKSVLALITGVAVDDGIIASVDDPVGNYIAEWKGKPEGDVPLRDFLTMSSGIEDAPMLSPKGQRLFLSTDIDGAALDYRLAGPAESIFRYNNVNSQIVGIAIDRAVKAKGYEGFADYLQQRLWCPLGNADANLWLDRPGGSPRYYAGMFARAADWARIGELIRNGGMANGRQIVSREWLQTMTSPSRNNAAYGFQTWLGKAWAEKRRYSPDTPIAVLHSAPYLADDVVFFDGFGGQRVYIVPSKGLTIVRTGLVNFNYDDAVIVNAIIEGLE